MDANEILMMVRVEAKISFTNEKCCVYTQHIRARFQRNGNDLPLPEML